jgi:hypothetical protein
LQLAYNTTINMPGGKPEVFARRERPKLLANAKGVWGWLYNGVIRGGNAPDGTYTSVAALGN